MSPSLTDPSARKPADLILVVDDDPFQHALIKRFLPDRQLAFASSAAEALEILKNDGILLVVTDMRMPGLGGQTLEIAEGESLLADFLQELQRDSAIEPGSEE